MNNSSQHQETADPAYLSSFPTEGRLLVVDDEESLRITTAAILEREGYVVDTASSGDEAIALLQKLDYDLVLTDLHMEGGDGLSVLNQIRQHAPLTISVVLTGFASVESAIAALQGRIQPGDAILVKGSNSVGLAALVDALAGGGAR